MRHAQMDDTRLTKKHGEWCSTMLDIMQPHARRFEMTEGSLYCTGGCTEWQKPGSCKMHAEFVHKQKNMIAMAAEHASFDGARVLEIGFNSGAGSLAIALGAPNARIDCVDIGKHRYVRPCFDKLRELVGNEMSLTIANSHAHLPSMPEETYDFIHVDGDHSTEGARADIRDCIKLAKVGAVLIVDDTDCSWIRAVADEFVLAGQLEELPKPYARPAYSSKDHAFMRVVKRS